MVTHNGNQPEHFNKALQGDFICCLKGPLSGLRQFLSTESLLKAMKNAFYFSF